MTAPEVEDRLRAHVVAILAGAAIPAHARADLEEELFGHLVERWRAHMADGLDEAAAAERALADFGTTDVLGRELGRTYHSRLWASTIGVLLPAVAPTSSRPGVVGWLRFVLGLAAVLTAIALAIALSTLTPLRALGSGVALVVGLMGLVLAYPALGRGQRWALYYAIGSATILLLEGVRQFVAPEQPGSITISLGGILGAAVLLAVLHNWRELEAFVAPSARLNRALGFAVAIALLAPTIVPRALAGLPDPTQANAADLEMRISLTCDRGDIALPSGPRLVDVQRATLVIDMTWSHGDVLPYGLVGAVNATQYGDTSGLRVVDPAEWSWDWAGAPTIVDTATGETAGWWGGTSPSIGLLPTEVAGSFTIAIGPDEIRQGRTIRATWILYGAREGAVSWPRIEVMYAHLDRFLLAGIVGCGETVVGRPIALHVDESPPAAPPLPF